MALPGYKYLDSSKAWNYIAVSPPLVHFASVLCCAAARVAGR